MKLFVTNKSVFECSINNSKEIHRKAYNYLQSEIAQQRIPMLIIVDDDALFRLKSVSDNGVCFYEFNS